MSNKVFEIQQEKGRLQDTGDFRKVIFVAGDVNHQSLREVWNGKLKELRQYHLLGKFHALPENCRECKDWQAARSDYYSVNT